MPGTELEVGGTAAERDSTFESDRVEDVGR